MTIETEQLAARLEGEEEIQALAARFGLPFCNDLSGFKFVQEGIQESSLCLCKIPLSPPPR